MKQVLFYFAGKKRIFTPDQESAEILRTQFDDSWIIEVRDDYDKAISLLELQRELEESE